MKNKDYVTANSILRMLGDCVAVFHLVYMEPNADYRLLRHCLYVIDGCERNLEVLPKYTIREDQLPEDELKEANKIIDYNVGHRKQLMRDAQEMLSKSPLKQKDEVAFTRIVEDRNWKFKEFKDYKKIKTNQYQWRDLYDQIDYCDDYDILSYLSQFAHGLSMSNLIIEMDESNCDDLVGLALGIIDRMNAYVLEFYNAENLYILQGLLQPEMRDKILACYDKGHRPTVAEWERKFSLF